MGPYAQLVDGPALISRSLPRPFAHLPHLPVAHAGASSAAPARSRCSVLLPDVQVADPRGMVSPAAGKLEHQTDRSRYAFSRYSSRASVLPCRKRKYKIGRVLLQYGNHFASQLLLTAFFRAPTALFPFFTFLLLLDSSHSFCLGCPLAQPLTFTPIFERILYPRLGCVCVCIPYFQ